MVPARWLPPFLTSSIVVFCACMASCAKEDQGENPPEGGAGSAGVAGSSTGPTSGRCDFTVETDVSPMIGTVGVVRWSVVLPELERARIEFGAEGRFEHTAPVDLNQPDFRTLLLGLTPSTPISFKIIAEARSETCNSSTYTFSTGEGPNGSFLPDTVETAQEERVAPGFLVTSQFLSGRSLDINPDGAMAYILDHRGRLVWWYRTPLRNISRALLSFDGQYLLARNVNVGLSAKEGKIFKVSLDGLETEIFDLPTSHHDMAPLPDGGLAIIRKEQGEGTCDEIVRLSPEGTLRRIYSMRDAYPSGTHPDDSGEECHCNSLHYNAIDDTFTVSDLFQNSYTKITTRGDLVWVLGGEDSHFSGVDWHRQHGHHMVSPTRIFFFNNNSSFEDSVGLDVTLNLEEGRASSWTTPEAGFSSTTLGDAQVLANGNYLMTYSNEGVIQELDASGAPVQTITFGVGAALGYVNHRPTLYGPPPR